VENLFKQPNNISRSSFLLLVIVRQPTIVAFSQLPQSITWRHSHEHLLTLVTLMTDRIILLVSFIEFVCFLVFTEKEKLGTDKDCHFVVEVVVVVVVVVLVVVWEEGLKERKMAIIITDRKRNENILKLSPDDHFD